MIAPTALMRPPRPHDCRRSFWQQQDLSNSTPQQCGPFKSPKRVHHRLPPSQVCGGSHLHLGDVAGVLGDGSICTAALLSPSKCHHCPVCDPEVARTCSCTRLGPAAVKKPLVAAASTLQCSPPPPHTTTDTCVIQSSTHIALEGGALGGSSTNLCCCKLVLHSAAQRCSTRDGIHHGRTP